MSKNIKNIIKLKQPKKYTLSFDLSQLFDLYGAVMAIAVINKKHGFEDDFKALTKIGEHVMELIAIAADDFKEEDFENENS